MSGYAFDFPDIEGWHRLPEVEQYDADNLFEYINGAAESYLSFGFRDLEVAEYQNGDASVLLEIYHHTSPEEAFGIYAQERPREGSFRSIGYQGYRSGEIFCMVAAEYYIKLVGNRLKGDPAVVLEKFAGEIANQIPGGENAPGLLEIFPKDSLIISSEGFIARNFLGYAFFKRAFTADYPGFRLFLMNTGSEEAVSETLRLYTEKLNILFPGEDQGKVIFDDPYHGKIILAWRKNYLWGAFEIKHGQVESYVDLLGQNLNSKNPD